MLELPILAIFATCIAGMIRLFPRKTDKRPVWERKNGKQEMEVWLTEFLAKLKRTSTRTEKCRLISSVERMTFDDRFAAMWEYVRFGEDQGEIFYNDRGQIQKIQLTDYQNMILKSNSNLINVMISRSEIREEDGEWEIEAELKKKLMSKGGEALVFAEQFGNCDTAVRLQIFDSSLFTSDFGLDSITWKIHVDTDFDKATDKEKSKNESQMPKHENVIRNFVNIELFHKKDSKQEDCLGWITIMEKAGEELRSILKEEKIDIEERKKIAEGMVDGLNYLQDIGILHLDRKLSNFLLVDGVVKVCDFGLVLEQSGRKGYREMGYTRRGSKYGIMWALWAGTPGFSRQVQLTGGGSSHDNLFYFLYCDWRSSWTLLYKPIEERERKIIDEIIKKCNASSILKVKKGDVSINSEITSIITIPSSSSVFCLDDPNLTKSYNVSSLKRNMTRMVHMNMDVIDQKSSNLCVPMSITTLIRFALKNDLYFEDEEREYSFEKIFATLTMIVYPRSMAGLNLNPKREEYEFQVSEVETLLQRVCRKTYLMESGWEIIRQLGFLENQPRKSTCRFEQVLLSENFIFTRPLTVTGAYLLPGRMIDGNYYPEMMFFQQMVLDCVDDSGDKAEYVIQNTAFEHGGPVLRIPKTRAYYVNENAMRRNMVGSEFKYYGRNGDFMWLVNEEFGNMKPKTWYLLPQAYSITLIPERT